MAVPNPPVLDTVVALSATQIKLDWTPGADGGSPITGYKIERNLASAGWTTLVPNTGNTNVTYTDATLTTGQQADYRVSAINAEGTSTASNVLGATTFTVPAAPVLTRTTLTHDTIGLSWPAPANGGSALTGYTVQTSTDVGFTSPASNAVAAGSDPTTYDKTGLTPVTQYWVRVKATNAIGDSAWSNVLNFTTEEALPKITLTPVQDFAAKLHPYLYGSKTAIAVDDNNLDDVCIIDARGCEQVQIDLKNTHETKGLTYEIQAMVQETDTPGNYDAAIYTQEDAGGNIAAGAHVIKTITKCYSWILIRAKRQTSGPTNDSELAVLVRAK